jgi:hypothetical protein
MNQDFQNAKSAGNGVATARGEAEETLRLIAQLPAPAGLEGRIHHKLRTAAGTGSHEGRVLAWPLPARTGREWMRAVAAAAIAFVIAGGGWGVYSRVQPRRVGGMTLTPHGAPGGFAGANAVRTPQTLNGPVVTSPAATHPAEAKSALASETAPLPAPLPANAVKKKAAHDASTGKNGAAAPQASATQK